MGNEYLTQKENLSLAELQRQAKAVNDIYVENFELTRDGLMLIGKLTEEMGEVASAYLKLHGRARGADGDADQLRRDFEDELADLLGFLALLAESEGVDLSEAFARKWGTYL